MRPLRRSSLGLTGSGLVGLSLGLSDALVGLSRAEDLGGGAAATSAGGPEGAPAASMLGCLPEAACWSWALVVA